MDGLGSSDILLFEGFQFDRRAGRPFRLDQAGIATPVAVGGRALYLLGLLLRRQGELVSKDEIMAFSRKSVLSWGKRLRVDAARYLFRF
jgi:DNA-binding winged helix-turn-helix (wHTH) protein